MVGTLLVFLATDAGAVRRFMADDPYVRAGLFEHWSVQMWSIGLGAIAPLAE
ncbi:YCII-related domain-containing protein [Sphingomonas sp. PP-F2F-A104-K0414]|nr:YCII-related domain-containing protein [Sphingomonas sp. PP-F2F-A104-K0414]